MNIHSVLNLAAWLAAILLIVPLGTRFKKIFMATMGISTRRVAGFPSSLLSAVVALMARFAARSTLM